MNELPTEPPIPDFQALSEALRRSEWLSGEPENAREEAVSYAVAEIATRFAGAPYKDQINIGYAIIRYRVWSERRRRERERAVLKRIAAESEVASAGLSAARNELVSAVYDAIAVSLSPDERWVLLRRFSGDAPIRTIAAELGVDEQRVYYLLRRAIRSLQTKLVGVSDLWER